MKKFSVVLCVLGLMHLSSLMLSAQEQIIEKLTVTVPVPVINHLPDLSGVTIDESKDVEIVSVKCPTAFGAKTAVTREEFILTLWKSEGRPESILCNQYLDIENHHQSDIGRAISWGHMNSIMGGTEAFKFSPKKTCTKAQVINFIHRYVK